jgi:hypothetical protein
MRWMIRSMFPAVAAVFTCALTVMPLAAQTNPDDGFDVTFEGIILHADLSSSTIPFARRAIVVESGVFTSMRHIAELILPPDLVVSTIRDATGGLPECDELRCKVRIQGFTMEIVARADLPSSASPPLAPPAPLSIDPTFYDYVPHLHNDPLILAPKLAAGVVTNQLPNAPAAGYFEISNRGKLSACAFLYDGISRNAGCFGPCDPQTNPPRLFARLVRWTDDQIVQPVLVIHSLKSSKPVVIEFNEKHPLTLLVHNRPRDPHRTSEHFVLFQKLLPDTTLPLIYRDFLNVPDSCGTKARVYVPGCADSGWP